MQLRTLHALHLITLNYMLLHTLHVIACITSITLNYILLHDCTYLFRLFWLFWLSQLLSDTLHHIDHGTTCFLFRATMLLCVQFEGTIGAEGLTFKLLERRLNNNFEPYMGKEEVVIRWIRGTALVCPAVRPMMLYIGASLFQGSSRMLRHSLFWYQHQTISCFDVVLVMKGCLLWWIMILRHKIWYVHIIFTWESICYIFDSLIFPSRIVLQNS